MAVYHEQRDFLAALEHEHQLVDVTDRALPIAELAKSPVAGVWVVFFCATSLYSWRSTEPIENGDPEHYPAVFRLDPATISAIPVLPVIPPLRSGGSPRKERG